jgi:tetratricopeptide (TPR) repeat protein
MADEFVNYYELLGISQTANDEEIKTAVQTQRKTWTSRQNDRRREVARDAEDMMSRIRKAERTLLDPQDRAKHNKAIADYVPPAPEPGPAPGPGGEQRDWVAVAADYLRQNRPDAAAGAAREATQLNGSNPDAWAMRGRASLVMNQADSAIFEFGEAVRLRPRSDEYHGDLGSAYQVKHDYDQAIACFRTAQGLAPDVRRYPMSIGALYLMEEKPKEALNILEPLHSSEPDDQSVNYLLAFAIKDTTFYSWTPIGNEGRRVITTREQVVNTKQSIERARGLAFDDDDLRSDLNRYLADVKNAEKLTFGFPGRRVASNSAGGCLMLIVYLVAIGILAEAFTSQPLIGIVLLAAIAFGWYKLAFKPRWKRNAADLRALNAATGNQGGINA